MKRRIGVPNLNKLAAEEGYRGQKGVDDFLEEPGLEEQYKRGNSLSQNEAFMAKTILGMNAEIKRVVELSIDSIEEMTGIPREEMFGTDETGEKVVYIGAPWQAKTIFDSERLLVVDYEYGEIATFARSFEDVLMKMEVLMYGEYNPGITHYHREIEGNIDDESFTEFEREWFRKVYKIAQAILENAADLHEGKDSEENLVSQLREKASQLGAALQEREEAESEIIEERKQTREETGDEFAKYHPVEGMHRLLEFMAEKVEQSLQDIADYRQVVLPQLALFEDRLPDNLSNDRRELLLKQEELSILNELRLKKQTESSHVLVGIFPRLPIADESVERVVCSYSISTHVIQEMTADDFRSWWKEIQRVLKPGGKAYIFPMQPGFPFGRTYDEEAVFDTLDEHTTENGGHLTWELYENDDPDAWREDTSLILTKVNDIE